MYSVHTHTTRQMIDTVVGNERINKSTKASATNVDTSFTVADNISNFLFTVYESGSVPITWYCY